MPQQNSFHYLLALSKARYLWIVWLLFLLGNAASLIYQLTFSDARFDKINTDIMAVLPKYQQADAAASVAKSEQIRNRQLLLAFKFNQAVEPQWLNSLSQALSQNPVLKLNDDSKTVDEFMALGKSLFQYRQQLLSQNDAQILAMNAGNEQIVANAREQIYGFGRVDAASLKSDPLFLYKNYLQSFAPDFLAAFNQVGHFLEREHEGRYFYLLPLTLQQSAFDANVQATVKQVLNELSRKLKTHDGELLAVGSVIFAEEGFSQTKKEMSTVGLGGIIGIVVLLLLAFGSLLPLCWLLFTLGLSLLTGLHISLLAFGELHIFALLFSSAIIGVGADYGFHYYTDLYQSHKRDSQATLAHILPSLSFGLISSVLAYALFLLLDFAVLAQVALLAIIGLPSMFLSVLLILPKLPIGKNGKMYSPILTVAKWLFANPLNQNLKFLQRPINLIIFLIIVIAVDVHLARFDDNVRNLQQLSTENLKVEQQLRHLLKHPYVSAYDVLIADDGAKLLAAEALLLSKNRVENYQPISALLPFEKEQQNNWRAYQKLYQYSGSLELSNELGGILDFTMQPFSPMDVDTLLRQSAMLTRFSEQLLLLDNHDLALFIPRNSSHPVAQQFPAGVRHYVINPVADISAQFTAYRQQMLYLLGFLTFCLLILALWRYRQHGIVVALMPAVAASLALLMTILLGFSINLFSVLALLLVLGMGLDYVVFMAETRAGSKVMVSLILSALSTLLSFGLLSFSHTAAVSTFGITVALGIGLILFLAPLAHNKRDEYEKKFV